MNQRTCNTCHTTKDLSPEFFYPSKKHEGGFNTQCRTCNIAKTIEQERVRRESNPYFDPNSKAEVERLATAREFYRKKGIDDLLEQGLKKCGACGSVLPLKAFNRDSTSYSKYASYCKSCNKKQNNPSSLQEDKA